MSFLQRIDSVTAVRFPHSYEARCPACLTADFITKIVLYPVCRIHIRQFQSVRRPFRRKDETMVATSMTVKKA